MTMWNKGLATPQNRVPICIQLADCSSDMRQDHPFRRKPHLNSLNEVFGIIHRHSEHIVYHVEEK